MKTKQKVRNWKDYNESLKARGRIIFTLDEESINGLYFEEKRKPGGVQAYNDKMYEYLLTVKIYLRLPWRAVTGLMEKLFEKVLGRKASVPHNAHASREANKLNLKIRSLVKLDEALEIALDSTGVNVYSKSGWHQTKYGKKDKCHGTAQWKKLHVALDLKSMEIISMSYTEGNVNDCEEIEPLLQGIKNRKIESITGDGAYDTHKMYELADRLNAKTIIPPSCRAQTQEDLKSKRGKKKVYLAQRDNVIREIRSHESYEKGLKEWKIKSGYHRRSRVESTMFRFKRAFGGYLQQKTQSGRKNEIICKINILNKMVQLGKAEYKTA
jgi:hypothetical protein